MSTPVITRRFAIDAGHRLLRHEGKCRHPHGHRYVVEVSVNATSLDPVGRVIDFGVIKDTFGGWLNQEFDHGFIVERADHLLDWLKEDASKVHVLDCPPSVENLVRVWYEGAVRLLEPLGVKVVHMRAYETETSWADYGGES